MYDPNKPHRIVQFSVITKNTDEIPILLEIAKEYLDSFHYNYEKIFVSFKYDSVPLDENFIEIPYNDNVSKPLTDFFMYIGMPEEAMEIFKPNVENYHVTYREGDKAMIESLFERYIHDYREDSMTSGTNPNNIVRYMDRYLIDLAKCVSDDDQLTVNKIKKGLDELRNKLWPE